MIPQRRDFTLAKDQPILQRARRRGRGRSRGDRAEVDFWLLFDLEKFASYRPGRDRSKAHRD